MPSKDPVERFADILENITLIEEFTRGMDLNASSEICRRTMRPRGAWNGSVKLRRNRGKWRSNFVPLFRGPMCVPWETSYDTNTTESIRAESAGTSRLHQD